MDQKHVVERRRGRRINLEVPMVVRKMDEQGPKPFAEQSTKNISLNGVYFEMDGVDGVRVNDVIIASVSIPESQRRDFPFTRLAGRSRVVRVIESLTPGDGRPRTGVACEFSEDVTVLTSI